MQAASVALLHEAAQVTFDAGAVGPADLMAAVEAAGFRAALAECAPAPGVAEVVRLRVEGMTCAACAAAVEAALAGLPGVASASVSSQLNTAEVHLTGGGPARPASAWPSSYLPARTTARPDEAGPATTRPRPPSRAGSSGLEGGGSAAAGPAAAASAASDEALLAAVERAGFSATVTSRGGPPAGGTDKVLLRVDGMTCAA